MNYRKIATEHFARFNSNPISLAILLANVAEDARKEATEEACQRFAKSTAACARKLRREHGLRGGGK